MPLIGQVSGSHTHLTDGTSHLIAGSNVTITTGSNGSVTVASSAGSTDPAGSNTQVQFNNGGSFGADADFFFVASNNLLNVPTVAAAGVIPASAFNAVAITSGTETLSPGSDTLLFVSGNLAGTHRSVFGGDAVVSGALSVGSSNAALPTTNALSVYANVSGDFAAKIDNDQSSSGHILQLLTDGNGSGTTMLEMQDGDGDTLFKARADGRFGFGASGVSSMGAGTFVVGIDGSHSADIAISKRLQHLGDSDTFMDFPQVDAIQFFAGGVETLSMLESNDEAIVLILSGGAAGDADVRTTNDVNFFVSGALDSKDTQTRGTAVFGGDLVVSGILHGGFDDETSATLLELNADAVVVSTKAGSEFVNIGSDTTFFVSGALDSKGTSTGGTAVFGGDLVVSGVIFGGDSENPGATLLEISTDTFVVSTPAGSENVSTGTDTVFFVSGAMSMKDNSEGATAVIGGDLVVSGGIHGGYDGNAQGNILTLNGDQVTISSYEGSQALEPGSDTSLFVSGAIGSRTGDQGGTSVFGGDVAVSGSMENNLFGFLTTDSITSDGATLDASKTFHSIVNLTGGTIATTLPNADAEGRVAIITGLSAGQANTVAYTAADNSTATKTLANGTAGLVLISVFNGTGFRWVPLGDVS